MFKLKTKISLGTLVIMLAFFSLFSAKAFAAGTIPALSSNPIDGTIITNSHYVDIYVHAYDADSVSTSGYSMTINGNTVAPSFYYDQISDLYASWDDPTNANLHIQTYLNDGVNTVTATMKDYLGNTATITFTIVVDAPPEITNMLPLNGTNSTNILPTVSAKIQDVDPLGISLKLNNNAVTPNFDAGTGTLTYTPSTPLAEGNYNVVLSATDSTGKVTTKNWSFTVDHNPPVFLSLSPANNSTIDISAPVVVAHVHDVFNIDAGSLSVTVDGKPDSGEVWLTGYWGTWDWIVTDYTSGDLYWNYDVYNGVTIGNLSDGPHTVVFGISDIHGNRSTQTLTFNVMVPPKINVQSPVNNSIVNVLNPTIKAYVTDNTAIDNSKTIMKVNGVQVVPAYDTTSKILSYTPTSNFPDESTVNVELTVFDTFGNPSTQSWSFFTDTYKEMPSPSADSTQCANCHTTILTTHPTNNCYKCHNTTGNRNTSGPVDNCVSCHGGPHPPDPYLLGTNLSMDAGWKCADCHYNNYPTIPSAKHTSDFNTATLHKSVENCNKCHAVSLSREHYRYNDPQTNAPMTCNTCHSNPPSNMATQVQNAIATQNTRCDACHNYDTIVSRHTDHSTTTNFTTQGCTVCHNTNLTSITQHKPAANTCTACHSNSDPNVGNAIANKNTDCTACHTPHPNNDTVHATTFVTEPQVNCNACHKNSLNQEHINKIGSDNNPINCATCHASTNTTVTNAISSGNTQCSTCHTPHPDTTTNHTVAYPSRAGLNCADCHTKDASGTDNPMTLISSGHLGRKGSNGQLMTCNTCHTNTTYTHNGKTVKSIIDDYINNKRNNLPNPTLDCSTCHDIHPDNMTTQHTTTYPASNNLNCNNCHVIDNFNTSNPMNVISSGHLGRKDSSNQTMTCGTCHNNTTFQVNGIGVKDYIAGIVNNKWQGNVTTVNCSNCHGNIHPNDAATPHTTIYPTLQNVDCNECHLQDKNNNNNPMNIISTGHINRKDSSGVDMTCNTCHENTTGYVFDSNGQSTGTTIKQFIDNYVQNKQQGISQQAFNCSLCHQVHNDLNIPHKSTYIVNPPTDCSSCHQNTLQNEHLSRTDSSGKTMTCNTCHANSNPDVVNAVLSKNTQCSACHNPVHGDLANQHNSTSATTAFPNSTLQCSDCHQSSLSEEHVTVRGLTCATCHNSTSAQVKSAIAAGNSNCSACHDVHPDINGAHQSTYINNPQVNCSSCHQNSLSSEHLARTDKNGKAINCDTCHKSTTIEVKTAIAAKNKNCDACHTSIHTDPNQLHTTDYMANPVMDCNGCHKSTLDSEHISRVDRNGNPITCDTCHNSSDSKFKNTIANHLSTTGNTTKARCDECHTVHQNPDQLHNSKFVNNPTFNCANCHNNVLNVEHSKYNLSCATCHNNKRRDVQQAIENHNINCDACHVISHNNSAQADQMHTTSFVPNEQFNCAGCHKNTLSQEHLSRLKADGTTFNCNSCHDDVVANQVIQENASSKVKTECNSCHQVHPNINDAHWKQYTYNPDSSCEGCHQIHPKKN